MKRFAPLIFLLCTQTALSSEKWSMVWATRSYDWVVEKGSGELRREGNILQGVLTRDDGENKYSIHINIKNGIASATFEIQSGDAGPGHLDGTYRKVVEPGPNNCWETIQLQDGFNYVGLLRNTTCKP